MDRHLNTVVNLSNRVKELRDEKADLLGLNSILRKRIKQLEDENKMLRADLKELNKFVYGQKEANKKN